jgi:RND family efflux transporter MFP subunit
MDHVPTHTRGSLLIVPLGLAALLAAACNGGSTPGAAAGPPPAAVQTIVLEAKPIEQTSEFIATLRSLRSTTVQPEVEGVVTRIFVKSGDRVRAGDPLAQINPEKQSASVRSTEANRAGTEADVEYWRLQVKRLEALVGAGAISKQEFEQAQNSLRTAEARLAALDAEVREGRVELQYYRVEASQAGTVGDLPIRPGDRVTTSTVMTTIDQSDALEINIQVPLDRSPDLRIGLPVQLLDSEGVAVVTNPITFVSPRVDDATQTVLVKSALREVPPSVRVRQFVRARIVWRTTPGITVPITAVTRVSGQHFCFIAEPAAQGSFIARQKPLTVGELMGNDYVVRSGVKAGDRLIVSGIQKLGDGAPVKLE